MIHETVQASRSVRAFDESRPIPREKLIALVDTARLCPCAMNAQPLRYCIVDEKERVEKLVQMTRWAAALPELHLPPEGKRPSAFLVVCTDSNITQPDGVWLKFDAGIAAQTIMLRATEMGYGGVMLGSFSPKEIQNTLNLPANMVPVILLALGTPDENIKLADIPESGKISYYRNAEGTHCVPKRSLSEVLL